MYNFNELFSKFTNRAKQVVKLAKIQAEQMYHTQLDPIHNLLGILQLQQGIGYALLQDHNIDVEILKQALEKKLVSGSSTIHTEPVLSKLSKDFFLEAIKLSKNVFGHNYVTPEHLLLTLLSNEIFIENKLWDKCLIEKDTLTTQLKHKLQKLPSKTKAVNIEDLAINEQDTSMGIDSSNDLGIKFAPFSNRFEKSDKSSLLKQYGRNLTLEALEGELDPVIGREEEIYRMITVLGRRKKNNPLLIGEPGSGKTAIVEALAAKIAKGQVPLFLKQKHIVGIDMPSMIAGTKYRGQFEERIKLMIEEAQNAKNIILFIDEMHVIVGAGSAEGAIDAANILKPSLLSKQLQCIGATTTKELRNIEKDSALLRRLVLIHIEPPSIAQTLEILRGLTPVLEEYYKCKYTEEALRAAVLLSDRYVADEFFPDKAIDSLEDAGSVSRVHKETEPIEIKELSVKIEELCANKEEAIKASNYDKALDLRNKEKHLRQMLKTKTQDWSHQLLKSTPNVLYDDVAAAISERTKVPLQHITQEEISRLKNLSVKLNKSIIGQEHVIDPVCKAITKGRLGLQDSSRPIASLLLLGTTGVGKTMLAKLISEHILGSKDALIRVDMSEFSDKFTSSKMIGAPPGYVGHDQGGDIAEKVRRRPYSVVLFDEIEKAHPDILNVLLQILDEGHLTDGTGKKTIFRNTIIVMTSNLGAKQALQNTTGFTIENVNHSDSSFKAAVPHKIMKALNKQLLPELIARIDIISVFNMLNNPQLMTIMMQEVSALEKRLLDTHGYKLSVDNKVMEYLLSKIKDKKLGARPMKKLVEEHIISAIADVLLSTSKKSHKSSSTIYVYKHENNILAQTTKKNTKSSIVQTKKNTKKKLPDSPKKSLLLKTPQSTTNNEGFEQTTTARVNC